MVQVARTKTHFHGCLESPGLIGRLGKDGTDQNMFHWTDQQFLSASTVGKHISFNSATLRFPSSNAVPGSLTIGRALDLNAAILGLRTIGQAGNFEGFLLSNRSEVLCLSS